MQVVQRFYGAAKIKTQPESKRAVFGGNVFDMLTVWGCHLEYVFVVLCGPQ